MPIVYKHQPSYAPVGAMALQTGQLQYRNQRRRELEEQQMRAAEMQQRERMANKQISANMYSQQYGHASNMQKLAWQNQFQANRDYQLNQYQQQSRQDNFQNQVRMSEIYGQQAIDRAEQGHQIWDQQQQSLRQHNMMTKLQADNWAFVEQRFNPDALGKWNGLKQEWAKILESDKLNEEQKQQAINGQGGIQQRMQEMYEGPNAALNFNSNRFSPNATWEEGGFTHHVGQDGVRRKYVTMKNPETGNNFGSAQEALEYWLPERQVEVMPGVMSTERPRLVTNPDGSHGIEYVPDIPPQSLAQHHTGQLNANNARLKEMGERDQRQKEFEHKVSNENAKTELEFFKIYQQEMEDLGIDNDGNPTEVDGVIPERETFNEWLQRKGINFSPTGSPSSTVGGSGDGSSYTSPIIVSMEQLENNSPVTQNLVPGQTWIKIPGIDHPMLYTPQEWRQQQQQQHMQRQQLEQGLNQLKNAGQQWFNNIKDTISGEAPVANVPPQG